MSLHHSDQLQSARHADHGHDKHSGRGEDHANSTVRQSSVSNGRVSARYGSKPPMPQPYPYPYGGVVSQSHMNHDPNGVHYHQTPPALAANPHYYDAHASTASNHAGVQNSFHGKQSQKTYDESEKSRTTIASKVTEADPWLGPDLSHAPWVPVIKQDEVESISDFTYQNFVDCWAMRDKRTYPSIWEIKSCQVKDSGATEGYEIKASWGIIQPMGLWYPKAHPQNVMVLRILQEMKALCGTGKDAFLKEYKWEDVKDAPVWRKHVKEWIFFGDTFHGILRRYKVSASCTEDLWDLVAKRAQVWKDAQIWKTQAKSRTGEWSGGAGESVQGVWEESEDDEEVLGERQNGHYITAC